MTAASGDTGETPQNEGRHPSPGGYEALPVGQAPAYGGTYPPQPPPPPPSYAPPVNYGTPYPVEYGYPAAAQGGTNTLAIVSLVSSVVGLLCGIGSIIGIVCGAVALNQIKRTREDGYGLAIAGIVIGVASLVISVVLMTFARH